LKLSSSTFTGYSGIHHRGEQLGLAQNVGTFFSIIRTELIAAQAEASPIMMAALQAAAALEPGFMLLKVGPCAHDTHVFVLNDVNILEV
jgi:hypothetical protein